MLDHWEGYLHLIRIGMSPLTKGGQGLIGCQDIDSDILVNS
jgi:hypothetical protein